MRELSLNHRLINIQALREDGARGGAKPMTRHLVFPEAHSAQRRINRGIAHWPFMTALTGEHIHAAAGQRVQVAQCLNRLR
ncbi:hypothetical protein D3C86_1963460 [compost metagenome]